MGISRNSTTHKEMIARALGFDYAELDGPEQELIDYYYDINVQRLLNRLGMEEVPDELGYILVETTVKRWNRTGSEGASSHNVEGESVSYEADDFAAYEADISRYLALHATPRMGIQFL